MSTIVSKCDYCNRVMFGDSERNRIKTHAVRLTKHGQLVPENTPMEPDHQIKLVNGYYICDNCIEYGRKNYMEVHNI